MQYTDHVMISRVSGHTIVVDRTVIIDCRYGLETSESTNITSIWNIFTNIDLPNSLT